MYHTLNQTKKQLLFQDGLFLNKNYNNQNQLYIHFLGESAVVIGNRIHKLGAVKEENRRFTTSDGKLDIAFESTYRPEDRRDTAYGWCSGKLVLGDGTEVTVPRTPAFIVPGR